MNQPESYRNGLNRTLATEREIECHYARARFITNQRLKSIMINEGAICKNSSSAMFVTKKNLLKAKIRKSILISDRNKFKMNKC